MQPVPRNDPVDVLIIGAGASGAAVAWSLADTRMRILCLEQGDWPRPTDFPSTGRDWEAHQSEDFSISPNRRGLAADYPINEDELADQGRELTTASAAGRYSTPGHFPRLAPLGLPGSHA